MLALLGATQGADPLAPYRDQSVYSVDIVAPHQEDVDYIASLIEVQLGAPLQAVHLQASIKRLYALGRFRDIQVSAVRRRGVVLLTFYLHPIIRVGDLTVSGLSHIDDTRLIDFISIKPGSEVDHLTPKKIGTQATLFMREVGYPHAKIKIIPASPNDGIVSFHIAITEHQPVHIAEITLSGQHRVTPVVLKHLMRTKKGAVADLLQLKRDRKRLKQALINHGFLSAIVGKPVIKRKGQWIWVDIPIDSGDRIHISFVGNILFTDKSMWAWWPEASGSLESGHLRRFSERIQKAYVAQGYPQAVVSVRGFRQSNLGITRYVVHIDEGTPVWVTTINFMGAKAIAPHTLEEQVRTSLTEALRSTDNAEPMQPFELELASLGQKTWGRKTTASFSPQVPTEQRWVPELYDKARNDIRAIYKDRGYLSVTISEAKVRIQERHATVHVDIVEGPQTMLHTLSFRGNKAFASMDLFDDLIHGDNTSSDEHLTITDDWLRRPMSLARLDEGRIAILRKYRDHGYLYAKVFLLWHVSEDATEGQAAYDIEEGSRVRLRRILIHGIEHTSEQTILSRIGLEEGGVYRMEQAIRDQRSIASLGIFSSVRVRLIDQEHIAPHKDLVAEVKERNRHVFDFAPGASTADGLRLFGSYTHLNLFGNASTFTLSLALNRQLFFSLYGENAEKMRQRFGAYKSSEQITKAIERDFRLSLSSRRLVFLPWEPSLRFDLTHLRDNTVVHSFDEISAMTSLELFPASSLSIGIAPKLSLTSLECPDADPTACRARALRNQRRQFEEGPRLTFEIGPTLTLDTRDNRFNPKNGIWAKARATYAVGIARPQGDTNGHFSFARLEGTVMGYISFGRPVFVITAKAGTVLRLKGESVPADRRFYLGGRDSLRAFFQDTLIPQDVCVGAQPVGSQCAQIIDSGDSLTPPDPPGGHTMLLVRSELRVPITQDISIDLFADGGNLWWGALNRSNFVPRFGVGASLRYNLPLGALVLGLGINPLRRRVNRERVAQPFFSFTTF